MALHEIALSAMPEMDFDTAFFPEVISVADKPQTMLITRDLRCRTGG
jgi:hypothetical protein